MIVPLILSPVSVMGHISIGKSWPNNQWPENASFRAGMVTTVSGEDLEDVLLKNGHVEDRLSENALERRKDGDRLNVQLMMEKRGWKNDGMLRKRQILGMNEGSFRNRNIYVEPTKDLGNMLLNNPRINRMPKRSKMGKKLVRFVLLRPELRFKRDGIEELNMFGKRNIFGRII